MNTNFFTLLVCLYVTYSSAQEQFTVNLELIENIEIGKEFNLITNFTSLFTLSMGLYLFSCQIIRYRHVQIQSNYR